MDKIFGQLPSAPLNETGLVRLWHYVTWLLHFWSWRCLKFAWFGPLGPSPWAPMGTICTIWTTLNPLLQRMIPAKFYQRMHFEVEELLLHKGPHWKVPWIFFVFTQEGIYTLHSLTVLLLDLENVWNLHGFGPWGSAGPHGSHTYFLNNFESPTPKDDSF